MHLLMPGYHENYKEVVFNPDYMELISPFKVFRFMDYMKTNNSKTVTWSDRSTPTSYSQRSIDGVAHEHIIDMSNRLHADPWICIPHMADDNYVREAAKLYKASLDKNLNLYLEYSNEVWNWQFQQAKYSYNKGLELGFDSLHGGALPNYYSYRTVQIIKIFEEVFAEEKDRIIGIMASQSVNPWYLERTLEYLWSETPLTHKETGVDAVSIAPYFGVPRAKDNLATYEAWSDTMNEGGLDKLFEEIRYGTYIEGPNGNKSRLEQTYEDFVKNKAVADREGLALTAYEGGQHLSAHGGLENNDKLQALFIAANRDPRMGELYDEYFRKWFEIGGGVFANFSFIVRPSKWGSWGVLESMYQDPSTAYKYVSLSNYAKELNAIFESENDIVAPSTVSGLTASDITETSLVLNWTAATDNVAIDKYQIFRDAALLAETSSLSLSDSGLSAATAYEYSVVAFDSNGNQSAPVSLSVSTLEAPIVLPEEEEEVGDDFIVIDSCAGLEAIADNLEANYKLESDIDCKDYPDFDPIGNWKNSFSGIFDGQGYSIKNLTVVDTWGAGLFTQIKSATVKNINMENAFIDTNNYLTGLITAIAQNSLIDNVNVTGKIVIDPDEPKGLHGGIVGKLEAIDGGTATLSNSSADLEINGKYVTSGGLVAHAKANDTSIVNISNCSFHGLINAKDGNRISAIVGMAGGHENGIVNIDKCFTDATMIISGNRYGSFLGQSKDNILISNSYSRMKLYSDNTSGDHQLYGQDITGGVKVENCFIDSNSLIDNDSRNLDGTTVVDFNIQNDLLYSNLLNN